MLRLLLIKDYALIEHISVAFEAGLNIITGETGAGKSILIDAMGLLLGERAGTDVIRKGSQKAIVEGVFDVAGNKKLRALLEEHDIDFDGELIVRRELAAKGSNRCFLNDTPVTLALIKETGNLLVDLHGQHEHQSLLRTETHIDFLDGFGTSDELLNTYREAYKKLLRLVQEYNALREKEAVLKEKLELYTFQIKEIDAVAPEPGEDERILNDLKVLENTEQLQELTAAALEQLYDGEASAYGSIKAALHHIKDLAAIDSSLTELREETASAAAVINELATTLRGYLQRVELDPERLEALRVRLGAISLLKKKYGGTLQHVLEHRERIGAEAGLAANFDGALAGLLGAITEAQRACGEHAKALSKKRAESGKAVIKAIAGILQELGIAESTFQVAITQTPAEGSTLHAVVVGGKPFKASSRGYDDVEFLISTNAGEDVKPLARVASGGEVSRIMLALKTILARNDKLPLLIFDEIDTGVSGRVAQKVGVALKNLARFHQIIAITHLPQIAALADSHYAVQKQQQNGRVSSSIAPLQQEQRVQEVAKLISGEQLTDSAIASARELMGLR